MINSIGTIALALQYAINIVAIGVYQRYPQRSRAILFGSLATCSLALLLAGFCTTVREPAITGGCLSADQTSPFQVWGLVLTQGVMFGLGGAFLYAPVLIYVSCTQQTIYTPPDSILSLLSFPNGSCNVAPLPPLLYLVCSSTTFKRSTKTNHIHPICSWNCRR